MQVSRAFREVRDVVGPDVSDGLISRALKDHAYSVTGAINHIVDLASTDAARALRKANQKSTITEVVELVDDENSVHGQVPNARAVHDPFSKRFREDPPVVDLTELSNEAKPVSELPVVKPVTISRATALRLSCAATVTPPVTRTASSCGEEPDSKPQVWPKVIGRRSIDAESTYRGRPPPEMVSGASLQVKRTSSGSQKNRIIRLATSMGTEIGRLPSELASILAPLLDAGCLTCQARVEFLPERLDIFTRFCVTIDFCVPDSHAFRCFDIAQNGGDEEEETAKSKKKIGSSAEDEELADKMWKTIQLAFGSLTVDGVYKERISKGAISLLDDEADERVVKGDEKERELSEDELFGMGKDAKLSEIPDANDAEVRSGLTVDLRPHQRIAVNWMKKREEGLIPSKTTASISHHPLWTETKFEDGTPFYLNRFTRMASLVPPPNVAHLCKGGILADEMGLGKTIVVLGRITQDINEERARDTQSASEEGGAKVEEYGTLVIVVTSLLSQWEGEIDNRVAAAQLGMKGKQLTRFTYYGTDRDSDTRLKSADIVLTTFGVVAAEFKAKNMTLFNLKWRRIVLDEAQSVRNGDTLQGKAVLDLQSDRRWCLTGTPVQNGIDDLFQLFRFIRLEPWGQRLWWDRVIEKPYKAGHPAALQRIRSVLADGPVLLRRTHKSIEEEGREDRGAQLPKMTSEIVYVDLSEGERAFYDSLYNRSKLEFDGMVASGKASTSYVTILSLLIRLRQAADHPFLVLGRPKGDKDEEKKRDDEYIKRLSAKYFSSTPESTGASTLFAKKALKDFAQNGGDCTICLCSMTDPVMLKCAHPFCRKCIMALEGNWFGGGQCPVCREPFTKNDMVDIRLPSRENQISLQDGTTINDADELLGSRFRSSSKLDRLVAEIEKRRIENKRGDKFLIFSQFTQMLDLCQVALSKMTPPLLFQRLDGSMSSSKRDHALRRFREDPEQEAMVMSLKAGCLGLNITCANVVVLLDPWWNAAIEHQAIGRAHRMGQTREVSVLRMIAKDTVEVKMLAVQERKKAVASDTLGFEQFGGEEDETKAVSKLTLDDLKEFFS